MTERDINRNSIKEAALIFDFENEIDYHKFDYEKLKEDLQEKYSNFNKLETRSFEIKFDSNAQDDNFKQRHDISGFRFSTIDEKYTFIVEKNSIKMINNSEYSGFNDFIEMFFTIMIDLQKYIDKLLSNILLKNVIVRYINEFRFESTPDEYLLAYKQTSQIDDYNEEKSYSQNVLSSEGVKVILNTEINYNEKSIFVDIICTVLEINEKDFYTTDLKKHLSRIRLIKNKIYNKIVKVY